MSSEALTTTSHLKLEDLKVQFELRDLDSNDPFLFDRHTHAVRQHVPLSIVVLPPSTFEYKKT